VCLLGPSGCGKSTALNVVAGFITPDAGTVTVDEEPVLGPGPDRAVVFQQYVLFPWLSVADNVDFGLRMAGMPRDERRGRVAQAIRLVGLTGFEPKYPKELSGGMQQRVGIARVMAIEPRVMLMDEPFGALDSQTRYMMQQLLLRVRSERQTTILFVTHDIDEAILLGDRIYLMTARPGRIKRVILNPFGTPRDIHIVKATEYAELKDMILTLLEEEMHAAFDQEVQLMLGRRHM
jgi:ABC-type nitrate/sulfonate/bicarbonate transport system ATPase subunit